MRIKPTLLQAGTGPYPQIMALLLLADPFPMQMAFQRQANSFSQLKMIIAVRRGSGRESFCSK